MCGILLYAQWKDYPKVSGEKYSQAFEDLIPEVRNRGPDSFHRDNVEVDIGNSCVGLELVSSVLSLRLPFTKQPVKSQSKAISSSVLQFNGELYNSDIEGNDSQYLFDKFEELGVLDSLKDLRGEYAFLYLDGINKKIWFGRDFIGRRSLLYAFDSSTGALLVTSVPCATGAELGLEELTAGNVACIDLESLSLEIFQWSFMSQSAGHSLIYPYKGLLKGYAESVDQENLIEVLDTTLYNATRSRLESIPREDSDSRIALLFSGGLDCTILAFYMDLILPVNDKIDLLNVAFENKRIGGGYNTPDRLLGHRSWKELEYLHMQRYGQTERFRFVEIDIPFEETVEHSAKVQALMWPKNSVMDFSIAIAFYFSARAKGMAFDRFGQDRGYIYKSSSKVLFSGLGADELFGGYTRHTTQLRRNGYEGLSEELRLDFSRLGQRNLGRDDRVCGCWGKELRYPYLDEAVVEFAMDQCPVNMKIFQPDDEEAQTKYILRLLAHKHGFESVCKEKKRAIQFGARSAKMEPGQGKIKGTAVVSIPNQH